MKTDFFNQTLAQLKADGLYREIKVVESGQGAYLKINGHQKLNLCSNNYLGLASHPQVIKAAVEAASKYGVGTASVRALSGTNILHLELEKLLAEFKQTESTLVLQGGYMANLAAIQTLLGKDDVVVSDELNHASIIDAVKLSGVQNKFIYKHNDMADLEAKLIEASKLVSAASPTSKLLVVTDGVFSMDGDLANLPEIVQLAQKYHALTMVDDAHGEGVLGDHGRGIVDHFHLHGLVDIEVGTLSKAFGVMGGFIAGKKELVEYYRQKSRQFLFSNGLSIPDTAALIETVKIAQGSDQLVQSLWKNTQYLKDNLISLGFDCGHSQTPIIPVMLGDEILASQFSNKLFEEGIYATPIKFPMVGKGKARIRLIPSAVHTPKDLDKTIKAFKKIGQELKILK